MQEEISLLELWQMLKRHLGKIIGLTVLFAALSAAFMVFFVQPSYSSNAQLIVNQQNSNEQQTIQLNEIQTNVQLINTYSDIITADSVLNEVSERSQGIYTPGELRSAISVGQTQNSQAFEITVTLDSPENAQTILDLLIVVFEETLTEIYENEDPNIFVISEATYNPSPVSPSLIMYLIIGAFIGLALGLLIAFITELSDTTVKDEQFLIDYGLINLGNVASISSKDVKETRISNQSRTRSRGE
ncbi:hypothetical protein HZY88_09070 [Aerococcaceae bacterium DSM 111176]|nr:hypothetical protein [Aerococcaceae bacterium DSM 111176]